MSMNLQQHMAKHMAMQFLDQAVAEWDSLYHNASMGRFGKWPDYDDSEMDIFWNMFMEDIRQFGKEDLQNDIKEQFGFDWKIGIYSSGWTTVAPVDIVNHVCGHRHSDYNEYRRTVDADDIMEALTGWNQWGAYDDEEDIDWPDAYRTTKACLEAFQYINQYCKGTMECLAESWEEFKINYPDLFESDEDEDDEDDEIYDENEDEYIEEEAEIPAAA